MDFITNCRQKFAALWNNVPEKQRQWGILILSFIIMIALIDMNSSGDSFLTGYHRVSRDSPNPHNFDPTFLYILKFIGFILGIMFSVFIIFAISSIVGLTFYHVIFRVVLKTPNAKSVATFIIILLILEILFHDVFCWIFVKTDAFINSEIAVANIRGYAASALSFMLLVCIIGYGFVKNSFKNRMEQSALLNQTAAAEIQALKAQINPHFLFNTLNNLYGTAIVEDSPKTARGIEQLAGIMRHAVESSKNDRIGIDKEIKFLHDYIEIQSIRLPKLPGISIDYTIHWDEIHWDEKPAEIAPLILMTFIENAFKYGISTNQNSFVKINLLIENQQLTFCCINSIVQRTQIEAGTGTGIENTQKRLQLLYPDKHKLTISQNETTFNVSLTIDLT